MSVSSVQLFLLAPLLSFRSGHPPSGLRRAAAAAILSPLLYDLVNSAASFALLATLRQRTDTQSEQPDMSEWCEEVKMVYQKKVKCVFVMQVRLSVH